MKQDVSVSGSFISRRSFLSLLAGGTAGLVLNSKSKSYASENTQAFKDSLGREINVPSIIEGVVPLGLPAQILVTTLCPDKLASLAKEIPSEDEADYDSSDAACTTNLPETGGLTNSTPEDVSTETISEVNVGILLDAGTFFNGLETELNTLQTETDTPAIFIDLSFGKLSQAYRTLGALLHCEERAERLACWVESAQSKAIALGRRHACRSVFYAPRENGLQIKGSIQVQLDAIRALGAEPFLEPYIYSEGRVNIQKLKETSVDFIAFDDGTIFSSLALKSGETYELWKDVPAIQECRYAASPAVMHSWFGSIILVQSLGILWLAGVMWPKDCNYSFEEEAREFYELFYGLDKSLTDVASLPGLTVREDV